MPVKQTSTPHHTHTHTHTHPEPISSVNSPSQTRSVGTKRGSFGVGRAKNEVILYETAQTFLSLAFKNSFYTPTLIYFYYKIVKVKNVREARQIL